MDDDPKNHPWRTPKEHSAWLVWGALMRSGEPLDRLGEYICEVRPKLGDILLRLNGKIPEEDLRELAGLHLVLYALEGAATEIGSTNATLVESNVKLALKSPPGRPSDKRAIAEKGRAAALEYERRIADGVLPKNAIKDVSAEMGVGRTELYKWLGRLRNMREIGGEL